MKKIIAFALALLLCAPLLPAGSTAENQKLRVTVTIFPIYDWVREIAGENMENMDVTMLLDSGADLHNFQPTAPDILNVAKAGLFIFVGGESDGWVDDVLKTAPNPARRTVNLRKGPGKKYAVVAEYRPGTKVTLLKRGSAWCKVKVRGRTGYIMTKYISLD